MSTAQVYGPWEPSDAHLRLYGYAPGQYASKCLVCDSVQPGLAKDASRCRNCAERSYKMAVDTWSSAPAEAKG